MLKLTIVLLSATLLTGADETTSTIPDVTNRIGNQYYKDPRYDPRISLQVSRGVMNFAHDLNNQLLSDGNAKSNIFSPVCLASSLSLLLMGSNGETYNQLNRLLTFDRNPDLRNLPYKIHEELGLLLEDLLQDQIDPTRPREQSAWRSTRRGDVRSGHGIANTPNDHIIRVSNGLFVQNGYNLRYEYKSVAESVYRSEVTPLDFIRNGPDSKNYINAWVREKTVGKIPYIITDDIDPSTNIILASTLYFKGFWENSFISSATMDSLFYPDGSRGPGKKVKMMANGGIFPFYEAIEYDCRIIGFPYKGNLTTMYVIQPNDSNREKVRNLMNVLDADKIDKMIGNMAKKTAVLTFPKLHISNTVHLKNILKKMGASNVFQSGKADLSLIADGLQNAGFQAPPARPVYIQQPQQSPSITLQPTFPPQSFANGQFAPQQIQPEQAAFAPAVAQAAPDVTQSFYPQTVLQNNKDTQDYHKKNNLLGNAFEPQRQLQEEPLIFTRIGEEDESQANLNQTINTSNSTRTKREVKYKVESEFKQNSQPLRLKDLILRKRITKSNPGKKIIRHRRQIAAPQESIGLQNLDALRNRPSLVNPGLYTDDILHKIDLVVNEQGTEAAAATVTYLRRSGTDITFRADSPFIILIRHDPTRLPLFYGAVFEPTQ